MMHDNRFNNIQNCDEAIWNHVQCQNKTVCKMITFLLKKKKKCLLSNL